VDLRGAPQVSTEAVNDPAAGALLTKATRGITVSLDYSAAIAANRFGLGAKPGDMAVIGADGPGWLTAQLRGPAPSLQAAGLRPTAAILSDAYAIRQQVQSQRRAAAARHLIRSPRWRA
jgi:uncharacterized protein (DUF1800 family)